MKIRWTIVAAVAVLAVIILRPTPTPPPSSPTAPAASNPPSEPPSSVLPPPPVSVPPPTPEPLIGAPPQLPATSAATAPESPAVMPAKPAATPATTPTDPADPAPVASIQKVREDLDQIQFALTEYRTALGENPIGSNAEITKALLGNNLKQVRIGVPPGSSVNENGELCDRLGTPYFFHQISGKQMEIFSAGPDRTLHTSDDIIAH